MWMGAKAEVGRKRKYHLKKRPKSKQQIIFTELLCEHEPAHNNKQSCNAVRHRATGSLTTSNHLSPMLNLNVCV